MTSRTYASVWDALSDTPAEAANMRFRSDIMIALRRQVESWGLSQAEAAGRLGISQPRLNDLLRGRIAKFSLDTLVNLTAGAGLSLRLDVRERVDTAA